MRILINTSNLKAGGGLQVADSFISLLCKYSKHSFVVVLSDAMTYLEETVNNYTNCIVIRYDMPQTLSGIIYGKNDFLDTTVENLQIEAVFSVFGPALWRPKVKHVCGFARPQIVYTESPFWRNISYKQKCAYKIREGIKLYNFNRTADILITENRDVSERLSRKLPNKKIHTVTNCYSQVFDKQEEWVNDIQLPKLERITLLTISANYPHKNLDIIFKVIDYIEANCIELTPRFVLTLSGDQFPLNDKYEKYICLIGKVNISQCPSLYEQADIMFLPTLLECFSASYAEAMRMGVPILTSDLPFAHGLCGNAAEYCDPLSAKSIVEKIEKLQDKRRCDELVELGHQQLKQFDTADERADKYIQIIQNKI